MESKADAKVGKLIGGHFRILDRIGGGSFGEIYRGRNICTAEDVAIKLVLPRPS